MTAWEARRWLIRYAADLLYAFLDTDAITDRVSIVQERNPGMSAAEAFNLAEKESEVIQSQIQWVRRQLYRVSEPGVLLRSGRSVTKTKPP